MIITKKHKLILMCVYIVFSLFVSITLEASEYHVGTYNILVGTKGSTWDKRKENVCNFILYNNFDILGTQEVSPYQYVDLKDKLKGIYSSFGVGREDGKNKGEYSAIFYKTNKFELLGGNTFWLSETPEIVSKGWDAYCNRICTWVKLKDKNNNNEIWFFNTHLDHKGIKAREKSCQLIISKIKELCPKDANIVLVGDFNLQYDNAFLKKITEDQILKDSYSAANYKWVPTASYNWNQFDRLSTICIDQIYVSKASNVLRYGILNNSFFIVDDNPVTDYRKIISNNNKNKTITTIPLSDHYPVSVFVDFKDSNDSKNENDSVEKKILKKIFKIKK